MQKLSISKWIKFIIALITYILTVIWIGNLWLLLGIIVIIDLYITKFVPWGFWKKTKDGSKPKKWVEWLDALIFALVAVYIINLFLFQNYKIPTSSLEKSLLVGDHLFVSKVSYGPRMPFTPLSFPLLQNTVPITNTKSYIEWPKWKYKRLKGFRNVKNNDIVVFNFPAGDTVPVKYVNPDYYNISRQIGEMNAKRDINILKGTDSLSQYEINQRLINSGKQTIILNREVYGEVIYRPVDRRDNYVKRAIAIAGDTLQIIHNQVYIDGIKAKNPKNLQHLYQIVTDGTTFNKKFLDKLDVSNEDSEMKGTGPYYILPLTKDRAEKLKSYPFIKSITIIDDTYNEGYNNLVWPYSKDYLWTRDNFGPLWIPKKDVTIKLNLKNIVLYDRIITAYEGNKLNVKNGKIYINGKVADSYTFKMNYYFMMGDNRHKSADSRYWGFVPEDHIVGEPLLVWLSLNKDKSLFNGKIRWNRFFKWVAGKGSMD